MAGRIPEHVVEQIVRSADVVRLVGRYCELKQRGGRFWACCPFHEEKTASFSLDPDEGLFYCFGCKEGGNIFTFLQKMEGLTFVESLERLANDAGIDLSRYRTEGGPDRSAMSRFRALNELAAAFYEKCLQKARGGEIARDYLAGRAITPESIARWRLGFAPEGWEHFLKVALKRGYKAQEIETIGLVVPRKNGPGHYDRFRKRLMFPITDSQGRPIAFGARALSPEDEPKYLNSPKTPLFDKGRNFFGLHQARHAIRSTKTAAILEGYTDVIMAHQGGVENCVAVLGTALTPDHGRRLARLAERVVLVFDADEAGQRSASRSIEVLLNEDLDIRVASLPSGMDPCEYVVESGGEAFAERLEESVGFFEFRLRMAREQFDTSTLSGRNAAFDSLAQLALIVKDEARRDMIVRWIAQELGVRETKVWAVVDRERRRDARRDQRREPGEPGARAGAERRERLNASHRLPRELLGLVLVHPEWAEAAFETIDLNKLAQCTDKEVLQMAAQRHKERGALDKKEFLASLTEQSLANCAARAVAEEKQLTYELTEDILQERLDGYARYLAGLAYEEQVSAATQAADEVGDDELRAYYEKRLEKDRDSVQ